MFDNSNRLKGYKDQLKKNKKTIANWLKQQRQKTKSRNLVVLIK